MTDAAQAERAERLARLRERRGTAAATEPTPAVTAELPPPTLERTAPIDPLLHGAAGAGAAAAATATPPDRAHRPRRKRSIATNAKIITVGVSTTAVLGMIAGYGIADGLTSESSTDATPAPDVPLATIPPASPTTTPTVPVTTAAPQVIVVLVDAQTGRPISTTTGTGEGVLDQALGALPESTPAAPAPDPGATPAAEVAPATTVAPAPVQAPAAVDLAVPAVPTPAPQAAPSAPATQAAPAPAPAPQASSGGS